VIDTVASEEEGTEARKVGEVSQGGDVIISEINRILILGAISIGFAKGMIEPTVDTKCGLAAT
jgi:hypothetical protein